MGVSSGFYNSVNDDRKYSSEQISAVFDAIMEDGVNLGIGAQFSVIADNSLTVQVGSGRAWFNSTWLLNDDILPVLMPPSEVTSLNRIDAIVMEFDASLPIRANTIKVITGNPSTIPVRPALSKTEILNQYAIAYVYRTGNTSGVTQANLSYVVGTPETPYAVSRLLDRTIEPVAMHRNTFRGKNLGGVVTSAQKNAIKNGTFEDLYVGDYWIIGGTTWRIADIDYYYNHGDFFGVVKDHHLNIMPDTCLRVGKMQEANINIYNEGGYLSATARANHLQPMAANVDALFGASSILQHRKIFETVMVDGVNPGNPTWFTTGLEVPNLPMIYGHYPLMAAARSGPNGIQTESAVQLSLFRLAPQYIRAEGPDSQARTSWTRNILSPTTWAVVGDDGHASFTNSGAVFGFRPIFSLK